MQQLSNLDSLFLHLDTKNTPMHIGSLSIYDPSTSEGGIKGFKDILAYYESCQPKAKCFRRKLANVPFGIGNPYWIDDEDFDIEYHVRHVALPQPGDWRQLSILAGRLFSLPLDMSQPLWEVYVIEGLDNIKGLPKGCFALLHKIHHCAIDGVSGAEILAATHTLDNKYEIETAPEFISERQPSDAYLYLKGLQQQWQMPMQYVNYGKRYFNKLRKANSWFHKGDHHIEAAPVSRFNHPISPNRIFAGIKFDLDKLKVVKNAVPGTTLNDVIITICGGGLRKYLIEDGEDFHKSLIAMMPKSIRAEQQMGSEGNQISIMRVAIGSQIEDHLARLHFVSQSTGDAKELLSILGDEIIAETIGLLNPLTAKLTGSTMMSTKVNEMVRMFNTVITNVPGPNFPLYFMGCKMVNIYGMGPPAGGLGLFQVVFSYNGEVTIGIACCRDMMPDPGRYVKALQQSFDELQQQLDLV